MEKSWPKQETTTIWASQKKELEILFQLSALRIKMLK